MKFAPFLLLTATIAVHAAEPTPNLPPADVVARVLRASPTVQAAASQVRVEEANRERLSAGSYEWNVRLAAHQRKVLPSGAPDERFNEWNAQIERPFRLPGKAGKDQELGALGVSLAEAGHGDALHEAGRTLLKAWFDWLRETAAARQWQTQSDLLSRQAHAVLRRQQLGDAARLESVQAEAALAQAQAQQIQAEMRRTLAEDDLRRRFPGLPLQAPEKFAEVPRVTGDEAQWRERILAHSHELGLARTASLRAASAADRASQERLPDPTLGVQMGRERGGEEQIVGAYLAINLPGSARRAGASAALAEAEVAHRREAAVLQKIGAEAAATYQSATASRDAAQASREAAQRLERAAEMTARAYQLGEGSLNELLMARRLANEARLAATQAGLDALERYYRLQLDAHRLWVLEEEAHDHEDDGPALTAAPAGSPVAMLPGHGSRGVASRQP